MHNSGPSPVSVVGFRQEIFTPEEDEDEGEDDEEEDEQANARTQAMMQQEQTGQKQAKKKQQQQQQQEQQQQQQAQKSKQGQAQGKRPMEQVRAAQDEDMGAESDESDEEVRLSMFVKIRMHVNFFHACLIGDFGRLRLTTQEDEDV